MSKIGIDARMYGKQVSGIGTYTKNITDHIFELDKTNDYYLFLLPLDYDRLNFTQANVHKVKTDAYWYTWAEQTKFLYQLNKYQLDLMHFTNFNAPILYNKPRIHTIHDITPVFFPGHKQKSWLRRQAYYRTIKSGLKKSAKIITISQNTKQDLIKHFQVPEDKIAVYYLGIEKQFKIIENYAKIKELKDKYGITKPYLFFISAWRSHKNFEGLIKAFKILKKQYNLDYQLILGGQEDKYYPNIKKTIDKSIFKHDIITPGFIPDNELVLFYNAADLYVNPSFYEGFGFTGLEAMACATPVVSSNLSSLPEAMGEAAIYFDPYNINEMAQTINKVLSNSQLKESLKQKGFNQIKKYSWIDCAQKTHKIYQQIIQP